MKKRGIRKELIVAAGIVCTALFCFLISGLQLDEDFEISRAQPSPYESIYVDDAKDTAGKININTADIAALDTLEGIGEKMGERIIRYREQNGEFKQIEDIMKVQGIGKKTFEKLRDHICVSGD